MKAKSILLITFFFISSNYLTAQVGIGTTNPHSSSALDISSTNSGLLVPRVYLTSLSDNWTISHPATGLLVYNLTNSGSITPGFYYWEGSWKKITTSDSVSTPVTGSGWQLAGNTLSTGNEYLGTNSYHSLTFKVNNNQVSRYHPNGGVAIGLNAVANDNSSVAIGNSATASSSNQATAVGPSTNAAGYQSAAFGYGAKTSNNSTLSLGYNANASGYQSASIGLSAESTSNNAFAVGNSSQASGQQAFAIGHGSNASGQNSAAIGYQATTSQANAIVLGSSSNSNNKVGIGTNSPDERLHVVGNVKIVDGNQANGKVLMSDANGKATWQSLEVPKTYGEMSKSSNSALNQYSAISFGSNGPNQNLTLNSTSIQVQSTGVYRITYTVSISKTSGSQITPGFYLAIWSSEISGTRAFTSIEAGETRTVSMTKIINLEAYQGISLYSTVSDSDTNVLADGTNLVIEKIH